MGWREFLYFDFGYSKINRNEGDVFCFGKSQQGVMSSSSRMTLAV